jgi:outer membrane protein
MLMFKNKNKKATNLQLDNLLLLLQKFKNYLQPMKKVILIVALLASLIACNKNEGKSASLKTAYIDTAEILEKYEKFKAEDEKFKVKSEEMGRPLEAKVKAFQMEAQSFQQNAQVKGPQWAQQKGAELSQREQQLGVEQNALLQQLQEEGSVLRDSIIKEVKVFIKEYGKKKGYDYIYGTGDAATILYSKDAFNITEEVLKELNDKYKASDEKEEKVAEKK